MTVKPLTSNPEEDSFNYVQYMDGLYGVMLQGLRNVNRAGSNPYTKEEVISLAHSCLLSASKEYLGEDA